MKKILFALIILFTFYGCAQEVTLKSGLKYKDEKIGSGTPAELGDLVEINFKGWIIKDSTETDLYNDWSIDSTKNTSIIADSYQMNQSLKLILDPEGFIKGSEKGMVGMKPGGKRVMIIPSKLAYGKEGMGPVPPNTDIKLVVEMLNVKKVPVVKMWDVDSSLYKTTPSGLKYAIIKEGEGPKVEAGKDVVVHYSGFLLNGTKFDSSVERDEPITVKVGAGQVIKGWDEGLLLLKKGSKARFVIPDSLGYGDRAIGKIPAKSTLVFDVEVLDVK